jgi:hypothetical protein
MINITSKLSLEEWNELRDSIIKVGIWKLLPGGAEFWRSLHRFADHRGQWDWANRLVLPNLEITPIERGSLPMLQIINNYFYARLPAGDSRTHYGSAARATTSLLRTMMMALESDARSKDTYITITPTPTVSRDRRLLLC